MRRYALVLFVVAAGWMAGDHPMSAQQPGNGPCQIDSAAVDRAREAKKRRLRANGVPERYLHLLDQYKCIECIVTAPDTVHVTILWKPEFAPKSASGTPDLVDEVRMLPQIERRLRDDLASGRIEGFYVWISQKRCSCCEDEDQEPEDQDDWNDDIEANMDQVEEFDDPSDLGPLPDDLKEPPGGWPVPQPPATDFPRPGRRQLHDAKCRPCQVHVDEWNRLAGVLDGLWDEENSLQRQIANIDYARMMRMIEIDKLKYDQSFNTTRNYDRMKQIEELEKVNEQQLESVERVERELAEKHRQIQETEGRMAAVMVRYLECEKACAQTTTATQAAPQAADPPPTLGATISAAPPKLPMTYPVPDPPSVETPDRPALNVSVDVPSRFDPSVMLPLIAPTYNTTGGAPATFGEEKKPKSMPPSNDPVRPFVPTPVKCEKCRPAAEALDNKRREIADLEAEIGADDLEMSLNFAGMAMYGRDYKALMGRKDLTKEAKSSQAQDLSQKFGDTFSAFNRMSDARAGKLSQLMALRQELPGLEAKLAECNCGEPTTTTDTMNTTGGNADFCSGPECFADFGACSATGTCRPVQDDCRVPHTCGRADPPGNANPPLADLVNDSGLWGAANDVDVEPGIQVKLTDVLDPASQPKFAQPFDSLIGGRIVRALHIVIPPMPAQRGVRQWFNPLGLLARRLAEHVDRWRGSMGPRPLLNPRDLEAVAAYSSGQSMGLPKGVHVLLNDRGGSTGRTLGMQVLNLTGQPVRLAAMPFAVEPIRQQAQARVQQAFNRLAKAAPVQLDLAAYCLEFLKAPPSPNTLLRLAPAAVQKKYEAMSRVLRSAYRVQHAGLLQPDSNPAAYTDAIKQWSLWAVEQNFNEARFTDAFLAHTKKNAAAAGQPWTRQADEMIRKVSPNRWRDILKVLQGAGVPVPR